MSFLVAYLSSAHHSFVTDAPISFPHLFLRSLNEVNRSSSTAHALFHPVFIQEDFVVFRVR